jgi:hypothetical protein
MAKSLSSRPASMKCTCSGAGEGLCPRWWRGHAQAARPEERPPRSVWAAHEQSGSLSASSPARCRSVGRRTLNVLRAGWLGRPVGLLPEAETARGRRVSPPAGTGLQWARPGEPGSSPEYANDRRRAGNGSRRLSGLGWTECSASEGCHQWTWFQQRCASGFLGSVLRIRLCAPAPLFPSLAI